MIKTSPKGFYREAFSIDLDIYIQKWQEMCVEKLRQRLQQRHQQQTRRRIEINPLRQGLFKE
jgi:hypothetical protein